MDKKYYNIIPEQLTLTKEGSKIRYKASSDKANQAFIELLKENKDSILHLMLNNDCHNLELYPLAQNQKSQWFINQTAPNSSAYNVGIAIKVYNGLDISILKTTLEKLIEKNWPLRSHVFRLKNEKYFQLCQIASDICTPFIKENKEQFSREKDLIERLNQDNKIPFDIEAGPLFRTFIYYNEDNMYLLFCFHHIICDAMSLQNFTNDFSKTYEALLSGSNYNPEQSEYNYAKFIFDQYRFLQSYEGEKQMEFWRDALKNVSQTLELPADFKRPNVHQFNGRTIHFPIHSERYKEIKISANKLKVTLSTYLFTIFQLLLAEFSKQKSFCIGLPVSARQDINYSGIFGYLVNTLPIPCEIPAESNFIDLVNFNSQNILKTLENQGIPFPVIVDELADQRDLSRTPIFQVFYNFLNKKALGSLIDFLSFNEEKRKYGSLDISPIKLKDQEGRFDIDLEIFDNDECLYCSLKYNTDIFSDLTANKIVERFKYLLYEIISNENYTLKLEDIKENNISINITGTFTTEPLEKGLNFWLNKINFPATINFVGFNQVFQQLLDPKSKFNSNTNQINIVLLRIEDLFPKKEVKQENSTAIFSELIESIKSHTTKDPANKLFVLFCPPSDPYAANEEFWQISKQIETGIFNLSQTLNNLIIVFTDDFLQTYRLSDYYEALGEVQGNIPYKDNFFAGAATLIARKINAIYSSPFKAIVLDCDNTLWQGVVGELGANGVTIGEQEKKLQNFLIEQNNAGVLLCLCSKNNEKDVWEVFEKNAQMLLQRKHISFSRINWNPKSENIISLSKEINIGLDSFVFIDDNPIECEEVKTSIPSVFTIQKRTDTNNIDYITNSWVFDKNKITEEDKKRGLMYKKEADRKSSRNKLKTYEEFINGLQIKISINPVGPEDISRISQLTFRTNQFNFTKVQRTEAEIELLLKNSKYHLYYVHLEDKYGDYGIVGAIIYYEEGGSINIDTFLLSCRAFGKGVEYAMIAHIGEIAAVNHTIDIQIPFSKSEKNSVAEQFLKTNFLQYKFDTEKGSVYKISTEVARNFKFNPASIKIQEEDFSQNQNLEIKPKIINRNNFLNEISEKFSSLDSIVQTIYGNSQTEKKNIQKKNGLSRNKIETELLEIWWDILDNTSVTLTDNFFDVGGDSLLIPIMVIRIKNELGISVKIVDIFQYPTVSALAEFISPSIDTNKETKNAESTKATIDANNDIAIIGLSGKFPGADNIDEFWELIKNGKETISRYSREELEKKGVSRELLDNPNYVYAIGCIPTADKFDAAFFGFTPREADFMDPQHRIFLESCHEALEVAGYSSDSYSGSIGVFAGSGPDNYILKNLFQHSNDLRNIGEFQTIINNGKDFFTTHACYKLNLNGPSLTIQTACSTSLVSVHYACNSLLSNQCDISLAGGAFVHTPREVGYMYEPGGIFSPKGQCRPFDKNADGMLFGEGVGVVVLKRYQEAVRDNDTIWGIIKGSAVNNDGSVKVGYTAPSVLGQSKVVSKAQNAAGIKPSDISYIEAHGTGTHLGDPIEVNALTKVFRSESQDKGFCAIGSVKANIGHLDVASGIAGLIKTTLALKYKQIPPSINFIEPNPELQLNGSPFYVNTELKEWKTDGKPRIAGISSFGIGGTNAHCIVQEAPETDSESSKRKYHIIPVSAKTETALNNSKKNLINYLINNECNISDLSFTLLEGRKRFKHRSTVVCVSQSEIIQKILDAPVKTRQYENPRIVFLFTGQGSQYNMMAKGLYNEFPVFKECLDKAFVISKASNGPDLEQILFSEEYKSEINHTAYAQPALFAVQYGIAKLLNSFGISADALIGHSIGEITAACVSGLFSFEDALKLVIIRGRLMQAQKPGAMLSIQLPAEKVKNILPDNLDFALQNAPNFSVVSGDFDAITDFKNNLEVEFPDIMVSQLNTSHAFHSRMMDPALEEFKKEIADISFNNIEIPFVSNTTGTWVNNEVVSNVDYWVNHIRSSVNFVDGINTLLEDKNTLFIEVGPGVMLTTLLEQFEQDNYKIISVPTVRHPRKRSNDVDFFFDAISSLWSYGADHLFDNWYEGERRKRIPLPTYPFERKRHWIDPLVPFSYHIKNGNSYPNLQQDKEISSDEQTFENKTTLYQRPELLNNYIAPRNAIEERLAQIWQELLGIESIGIRDDFFELGGHSLLAISISSEIERKFSISFGLRDFYNSPSIIGISESISNKLQNQPKIETDLDPIINYNTDDNSIISSIIEIWKEYMGVPDIKPVDSFFDLGGHSLLAISISSEIERKFSISFGLRDFYKTPSVIGISECIRNKLQNQPE